MILLYRRCIVSLTLLSSLVTCREHGKMQCYDLGFALDTFRMVSLKSGFKRLGAHALDSGGGKVRIFCDEDLIFFSYTYFSRIL
jgi:hypothetical protein